MTGKTELHHTMSLIAFEKREEYRKGWEIGISMAESFYYLHPISDSFIDSSDKSKWSEAKKRGFEDAVTQYVWEHNKEKI